MGEKKKQMTRQEWERIGRENGWLRELKDVVMENVLSAWGEDVMSEEVKMVWVLSEGCCDEHCKPIGVFATEELARKAEERVRAANPPPYNNPPPCISVSDYPLNAVAKGAVGKYVSEPPFYEVVV